jgi:hypothetical protein
MDAALWSLNKLTSFEGVHFYPPKTKNGVLTIRLRRMDVRGSTDPDVDHIDIERSLVGDHLRDTVLHEIFHRIQYSYNAQAASAHFNDDLSRLANRQMTATAFQDAFYVYGFLREGGARLAEMMCGAPSEKSIADSSGWLVEGRTRLFGYRVPGEAGFPFAASSYDAALFWSYLAEQHGGHTSTGRDQDGIREARVQERMLSATGSNQGGSRLIGVADIRRARLSMAGPGDFDRFSKVEVVPGMSATICDETTWGNFLVASVLAGSAEDDPRYRFERAAAGVPSRPWRDRVPASNRTAYDALPQIELGSTIDRVAEFPVLAGPQNRIFGDEGGRWSPPELIAQQRLSGIFRDLPAWQPGYLIPERMLAPFEMRPYYLRMPSPIRRETVLIRLHLTILDGLEDAMVQVLLLATNGMLLDLLRFELPTHSRNGILDRTIPCRAVSDVVILVASRCRGGDFRLRIGRARDAPILQASTWNSRYGRYKTLAPGERRWDWKSRDIEPAASNRVNISVRNAGTAPARELFVEAWAMPASLFPNQGGWTRLIFEEEYRLQADLLTNDECMRRIRFGGFGGVEGADDEICGEKLGMTQGPAFPFIIPPQLEGPLVVAARCTCLPSDPNGPISLLGSISAELPNALRSTGLLWPEEFGREEARLHAAINETRLRR